MIADAALDADPERADLARRRAVRVDPATGMTIATAGIDAIAGAGLGHGRLQGTNEGPQQDAPIGQADDGVGDQLAGSVIGDLAAALDADELHAPVGQLGGRGTDEARVGLAPERQDGWMLEQQERVGDRIRLRAHRRGRADAPRRRDSRCVRATRR